MEIKKFQDFERVNEELVGSIIAGALGKLFGLFKNAFKDLTNDFKSGFKEDDLGSIKDIVMKNVDQAVDGAQKEINGLKADGDVLGIMDNMVKSLVELANGLTKDVEGAFGKDKSAPIAEVAKAILLGNKEADWVGIVGALDPAAGSLKKDINYKFSKKIYVTEVNKGKDLNAKKALATKFFDNMQKGLKEELEKGFTDEELKTFYDKTKTATGGAEGEMDYVKLKELFDKKTPVIYLLKGKKKEEYDPKKKPEEQAGVVGVKPINSVNDKNAPDSVVFLDKDGKPVIKKSYAEIIGPAEAAAGENAKKVADSLGKIKADEEKMGKVAKFADFIQNDANKAKIDEIEKIIGGGAQQKQEA
jgi:hypothetical protein